MLNRVIIMGRITHDLELKQTAGGVSAVSFSVAVDRSFKNAAGEYEADFIQCVAWRQTAEFIARYFGKGRLIAVEGQLRSRTYEDKNGTKHYVTEVYADSISFTGERSAGGSGGGFGGQQSFGGQSSYSVQSSGGFLAGTELPPNMKKEQSSGFGKLEEFDDVISDGAVPF